MLPKALKPGLQIPMHKEMEKMDRCKFEFKGSDSELRPSLLVNLWSPQLLYLQISSTHKSFCWCYLVRVPATQLRSPSAPQPLSQEAPESRR
mmetsp:Transcript_47811/g.74627  ORF Transcript_47811/g.74627 Transcript_47811/m.74627 type:complete len:92 (-) Transcript_47811:1475-1750(-)